MSFQKNAAKTKPCNTCKGRGKVVVDTVTYECRPCDGTGKVKVEEDTKNESAKVRLND